MLVYCITTKHYATQLDIVGLLFLLSVLLYAEGTHCSRTKSLYHRGIRRLRRHAPLRSLAPSDKRLRKNRILNFLSTKQHIVSPSFRRPISLKLKHKTWIGIIRNSFRSEFRFFFDKGSFTVPKNLFYGFFGTLSVRALQPWPLGLHSIYIQRIWALRFIVE